MFFLEYFLFNNMIKKIDAQQIKYQLNTNVFF